MLVRAVLFSFLLTLCGTNAYGQGSGEKNRVRSVVWTTPVFKNTTINGVALGWVYAAPWRPATSLEINGLNFDLSAPALFATIYSVMFSLGAPFSKKTSVGGELVHRDVFTDSPFVFETKITGASICIGGVLGDTKITGLSLNGGISMAEEVVGVEATGVLNLHYSFRGIMIAGLRNKVTTGRGLQIGLFNTCRQGQVVQIGLINRIGKRITPIVNFSFRRKPA